MIFPFELTRSKYSPIATHIAIYIGICVLHKKGIINDASLKAYAKQVRIDISNTKGPFNTLKKGGINRLVGTYKSNITGSWYNNVYTSDIWDDVFQEKLNKTDFLTFEEGVDYLKYLTLKGRNYTIDFIYFQIVKPLIDDLQNSEMWLNTFNKLDVSHKFNPSNLKDEAITKRYHDYCCEDCDGDYSSYVRNNNDYIIEQALSQLEKEVKNNLQSLKTSSSYYNPNNKLL